MEDLIMPGATVLLGDCLESLRGLAEAGTKVQMCVTSPPYFGLRDYGIPPTSWPATTYRTIGGEISVPAMTCCLGLEDTPEAFIGHMVEVFRAVREVLADDGTCWINIGDSYARTGGTDRKVSATATVGSTRNTMKQMGDRTTKAADIGLKEKDLIGIPWMLAFALRADGWYLRSEICWAKLNPMPESVTDRPTKSHEQLFLLSKQPKYFYDHEAIKEPAKEWTGQAATFDRGNNPVASHIIPGQSAAQHRPRPSVKRGGFNGKTEGMAEEGRNAFRAVVPTRNRRSVWTIATRPFKGAHFAVFPPALVEPCVLAGTSERGHCPECGARWDRQVDIARGGPSHREARKESPGAVSVGGSNSYGKVNGSDTRGLPSVTIKTTGWAPTCECGHDPVPDVVLDPFNGSGTTGQIAIEHGRQYVGCELNADYLPLTRQRLEGVIAAKAEQEAALAAAAEEAARQPDLFDLLQTGT